MGLDMSKIKALTKELTERSNLESDIVPTSKLGEETDFRIAPPVPELNGVPYIEQIIFWIGKKPYTSLETWGEDCPITEEIAEAKASKDPDLLALLDDTKQCAKKSSWLIPGWFLDCTFDDDMEPVSIKVRDEKMRVLSAGPQLTKEINREVSGRHVLPDITDRAKGTNLLITKTGKDLNTEYSAKAWRDRTEMDDKYYAPDKCLNVVTLLASFRKSPEYLRSVIRNYLYGEPILKEEKAAPAAPASTRTQAKPAEEAKPAVTTRRGAASAAAEATTATPTRRGGKAAEEEKPAATPRRTAVRPPDDKTPDDDIPFEKDEKPKAKGKRNLSNDLANLG